MCLFGAGYPMLALKPAQFRPETSSLYCLKCKTHMRSSRKQEVSAGPVSLFICSSVLSQMIPSPLFHLQIPVTHIKSQPTNEAVSWGSFCFVSFYPKQSWTPSQLLFHGTKTPHPQPGGSFLTVGREENEWEQKTTALQNKTAPEGCQQTQQQRVHMFPLFPCQGTTEWEGTWCINPAELEGGWKVAARNTTLQCCHKHIPYLREAESESHRTEAGRDTFAMPQAHHGLVCSISPQAKPWNIIFSPKKHVSLTPQVLHSDFKIGFCHFWIHTPEAQPNQQKTLLGRLKLLQMLLWAPKLIGFDASSNNCVCSRQLYKTWK